MYDALNASLIARFQIKEHARQQRLLLNFVSRLINLVRFCCFSVGMFFFPPCLPPRNVQSEIIPRWEAIFLSPRRLPQMRDFVVFFPPTSKGLGSWIILQFALLCCACVYVFAQERADDTAPDQSKLLNSPLIYA